MTSDQLLNIATSLMVPFVAAVAGVTGLAFKDWRAHRNAVSRRKEAFANTTAQVSLRASI
jgi:hypothetical protein